ncbi:basic leucine zipper 61-like [Neltuma alba]|uniref:basic leucine zipper 61-like n=1 Tax=Neltuma alba TaxID=207710 RepID=UPI0010A4ADB2|nr:basic leucine zipper 61-like [Prosopis alba]
MAQLPPKIPNTTLCWSDLSDSSPPNMPYVASFSPDVAAAATRDPLWADEFHDFSSERRQAHRRSVSDSIGFFEAPMLLEDCHVNSRNARPRLEAEHEFDRFGDEKFMSPFNDDLSGAAMPLTFSSSKSSSPSDHNSINDEKEITNQVQQQQNLHKQNEEDQPKQLKSESHEVQNHISKQQETQPSNNKLATPSSDKITDPKRVKRILANRQSAQRSRVRKLQYIIELERSVTSLQAEVSVLSPRVAFLDQQRLLLNVDNGALKQRLAALAQDKIFKDALQDALKREIERLRQVYHQQNHKKLEYVAGSVSPSPNPQCHGLAEKEQLLNELLNV